MQQDHEDQIQHHVDDAGEGQIDQGAFGIAGSPEDGGAEVIEHGEGDTGKVYPHIHGGKGQYVGGGAHEPQEILAEDHTNQCQNTAADQSGGDGGMNRPVDGLKLMAAQTVGNGDTGTYGQADEEVHHQIGEGIGGTYGCHGNTAAEPAYHHQIGGVEQKLQHTGEDNGNGIKKDIG